MLAQCCSKVLYPLVLDVRPWALYIESCPCIKYGAFIKNKSNGTIRVETTSGRIIMIVATHFFVQSSNSIIRIDMIDVFVYIFTSLCVYSSCILTGKKRIDVDTLDDCYQLDMESPIAPQPLVAAAWEQSNYEVIDQLLLCDPDVCMSYTSQPDTNKPKPLFYQVNKHHVNPNL